MLKRLRVKGLWSLADIDMELRPMNVALGANGSGKSGLLNVFRLTRALVGRGLSAFVAQAGGASSVLHYGSKVTRNAEIELEFEGPRGLNGYSALLTFVAADRLVFAEEKVWFRRAGADRRTEHLIGPGAHPESYLANTLDDIEPATPVARAVKWHLDRFCHYHFHDTSLTAALRGSADADDTAFLRPNGENLAAYLLALRVGAPEAYSRIRATVRRVFPRFDDFVLDSNGPVSGRVLLRWREAGNSYDFGPHHLSDGTLRFIAYATLLLQPTTYGAQKSPNFPQLIVIDEPELGLHPSALTLLGELLRAFPCQRIVATQSVEMVVQLVAGADELEDILLVDRPDSRSFIRRADPATVRPWLDDYDPARLWTHGIIGAFP